MSKKPWWPQPKSSGHSELTRIFWSIIMHWHYHRHDHHHHYHYDQAILNSHEYVGGVIIGFINITFINPTI